MWQFIDHLYATADAYLVVLYRITGIAMLDFFIGTLLVSLIAVVAGEFTVSLAIRFNRRYNDQMGDEASRMEQMSIAAYESGNMEGYRALNRQATDAWGKHFFTMAAYSAGILWPIPFVLTWMQWRFGDVTFPVIYPFSAVTEHGVGYLFTFFPLYVLARIIFKRMRPWLPYFKGVQKMLDEAAAEASMRRIANQAPSAAPTPEEKKGRGIGQPGSSLTS